MNLAHFSSFGVAVAVYLIGTAMPGPGNLSIGGPLDFSAFFRGRPI